MNTAEMIAVAIEARKQSQHPAGFLIWDRTSAAVFNTAGEVICVIDHGKSDPNKTSKHCAARFTLNGKTIARSKLDSII